MARDSGFQYRGNPTKNHLKHIYYCHFKYSQSSDRVMRNTVTCRSGRRNEGRPTMLCCRHLAGICQSAICECWACHAPAEFDSSEKKTRPAQTKTHPIWTENQQSIAETGIRIINVKCLINKAEMQTCLTMFYTKRSNCMRIVSVRCCHLANASVFRFTLAIALASGCLIINLSWSEK